MKILPLVLFVVGILFLSFDIYMFREEAKYESIKEKLIHDDTLSRSEFHRFQIESKETVHTLGIMLKVLDKLSKDPVYKTEYDLVRFRMHDIIEHSDAYGEKVMDDINIRLLNYNMNESSHRKLKPLRLLSYITTVIGFYMIVFAIISYIKNKNL